MKEERTPKRTLQEIEHKMRTWRNPYFRKMEIYMEIAININSYKGKEQRFWMEVADLYDEKYGNFIENM